MPDNLVGRQVKISETWISFNETLIKQFIIASKYLQGMCKAIATVKHIYKKAEYGLRV